MFQIKDFNSIVAAMLNHARATTRKITDWMPGSVARTLVEAPAVEIEELYLQMFIGLREAIPVATFRSFGFEKLAASYAHGFVSISVATPLANAIPIPAGTEFTTDDGRSYLSTADVTWAAGQDSVRIPVAASSPGLSYNVSAGAITTSANFGSEYSISNALIENGRDDESDEEREARFAAFIAALSGGTVAACSYATKSAVVLDADGNIYEYVTRIGVNEQPGFVRIYIYSSMGVPSAGLIGIAQGIIDGTRDEDTGAITPGYRSGGVRVDVMPMVERLVPFSAKVDMLTGYELTPAVRQDLLDIYAAALDAIEPGSVLQIGTLEADLLGVAGIRSVVPTVTENITCDVFEALKPGTFTITAL